MECETQETHTSPFLSTPFVLVLFSLPKVESQLHPVPFLTTRFSFFWFFFFNHILYYYFTHFFFFSCHRASSLKRKEGDLLDSWKEQFLLFTLHSKVALSFSLSLSVEYIVFFFLFSLFNLYINSSVSPSLSLSLALCSVTFVAARCTHKQKRLILSYYLLNFS